MTVPVALFAYTRTEVLQRTLECLRRNGVSLIHAFSDGPRSPERAAAVARVREILRGVDWAEVRLVERPRNLGLGVSIRAGVEEVLAAHGSAVVFEDDLEAVPGTYAFLCQALEVYRDEPRVLSVTGWTHPSVTPAGLEGPYFDGRTECLVWGTWRRAWRGMEKSAAALMAEASARGIDPRRYGDDLVQMAREEGARNLWAVRWSYLHISQGGLCLRPPHSLVEHLGLDAEATNAATAFRWANPSLGPAPAPPVRWPPPIEHPDCPRLWRRACGRSLWRRALDAAAGRLAGWRRASRGP
jgi:hypothetical protein